MIVSQEVMGGLSGAIDIHGKSIAVGTRVRSFDHPLWCQKSGEVLGMETDGKRVDFIEGLVEAIGGRLWFDTSTISGLEEQSRQVAADTDQRLGSWATANKFVTVMPIIITAASDVTED
ncbi:MAG: hypothetical protein F8N36_13955 [Desulfovibrio sp.]|uniref:hypothetical protein n=1 Tax=Desulfovibrio sp. TaxID=885 RepID=UPI00135EE521|nr:hypothetical protein [Desulfovibrio sp.]MTJ93943.1 hypothetical protein [Desulfovibrio sp.]